MLRMSPFAVRWLLAEYEPPVSSQVQQLRLVLLLFPLSVISFFVFINAHLTEVHVTVHSDSLSDWTSVQMAQLTSHYPDSSPVVTTQITSNGVSMSRVLFTAATCQMWDSCRAYPRLVFCGLSQSLFTSEGKTPKPEPAAHLQQQFLWSDLHEDVFFYFSFVNTRFFFSL